jgi:Protein of unknown function (DUF3551)
MRLPIFILGIGVGIVGIGNRAEAQNYPWCALYKEGAMNCGFTTFQQCLAHVSNTGICMENNTYQPPPGPHPLSRAYRHARDRL